MNDCTHFADTFAACLLAVTFWNLVYAWCRDKEDRP